VNLYKFYGLAAGLTVALVAFAIYSFTRNGPSPISENRSGAASLSLDPTATTLGQGISRSDFVQVKELDTSSPSPASARRAERAIAVKVARKTPKIRVAEAAKSSAASQPEKRRAKRHKRIRHTSEAGSNSGASAEPPRPEFDALQNDEESSVLIKTDDSPWASADAAPTAPWERHTRRERKHRRKETRSGEGESVREESTVVEETHNPDGTEEVIREHKESVEPE